MTAELSSNPDHAPAGDAPPNARVPPGRIERYAPWAVGLLLALPILLAKYPPL
jgi:hypothetical protein